MARAEILLSAVRTVGEKVGHGGLDQLTRLSPDTPWEYAALALTPLVLAQMAYQIGYWKQQEKQLKNATNNQEPNSQIEPNGNPQGDQSIDISG